MSLFDHSRFNTQPPEGGWVRMMIHLIKIKVSTHSRLKAAGYLFGAFSFYIGMFQHTAA